MLCNQCRFFKGKKKKITLLLKCLPYWLLGIKPIRRSRRGRGYRGGGGAIWLLNQLILQRVAEQRLRSGEGGCWHTAGAQFRQWRLPRHLNRKTFTNFGKMYLVFAKNCI
jgi:hypothetical protein